MMPWACWMMPTSSTSVSRWSLRKVGELVDREEAVVELHVRAETELEHAPLEHQAVPLALSARDVGMRAAGDRVDDLGVTLDERGERLDHRLQALAGRDQPEGGEY